MLNADKNPSRLVAEVTVSSAVETLTISGLDINRGGGVYDFIIQGTNYAQKSNWISFRVNGLSPARYYTSYVEFNGGGSGGQVTWATTQANCGILAQNSSAYYGSISLNAGLMNFYSTGFYLQTVAEAGSLEEDFTML